jgi:iron(III) transport system permease protein
MSGLSIPLAGKQQRQTHQHRPARMLVILAMLVSLLALLPVGFVIATGIDTGWESVKALVFRPRVAELLANTLLLILFSLPICVCLGVALAWLTERTALRGRRVWSLLVVAPLAIPAFVQSYAWVSVIPSLHGLAAAVFISVLAYYPFIYMPVAAVLRRLDPNLEDVAASLGIAPWQVFFRVVLPQLKLAIWGGALLVGLHLLAEYGLYVMIRFDTFTTAIYDQFQSTFSGPAANMLAGVLALCCLGLLLLEGATRGKARYARVGEAPPAVRISMHPQWQVICWDNSCWLRGRAGAGNAHRGAGALAVGGRPGGLAER